MLIKIALNGVRTKAESKHIPHSLEEIINSVKEIVDLPAGRQGFGFTVFHIHVYDSYGKESLKNEDLSSMLKNVRKLSPKIKIGISTGDWIVPDFNERLQLIKEWNVIPDFASVNIVEENSLIIAEELIRKGVSIEAGIIDPETAEKFVNNKIKDKCLRILIEPQEENLNEALVTVKRIESVLDKSNISLPRLLHGFDNTAWGLIKEAMKKDYETRIGLEDTIFLPSGEKAKSNLELLKVAVKIKKILSIKL